MIKNLNFLRSRRPSSTSTRYLTTKDLRQKLFSKGETFRGTIIRAEPGGKVLVSGKGAIFTAYSMEKLLSGHVYQFLVRKTRPVIELRIVSAKHNDRPSALGLWASTRPARGRFGEALIELQALISETKAASKPTTEALEKLVRLATVTQKNLSSADTASQIARLLMASGIFFESKLANLAKKGPRNVSAGEVGYDLKHVLLRILGEVEHSNGSMKDNAAITEKVIQMLHLIERHQILNLLIMEGNLGWFWFLPIYDGKRWDSAELLTKKLSAETFSIWINLRLSRLGPIRARVDLKGRSVGVTFYVDDHRIVELVSAHKDMLDRKIQAQGLRLTAFFCNEAEEDHLISYMAETSHFEGLHVEV